MWNNSSNFIINDSTNMRYIKMEPFPGEVAKRPKMVPSRKRKDGSVKVYMRRCYELTDGQKAWLRAYYPEVENKRLMKASGISVNMLHKFARELGLGKSEKGMYAIRKRRAAAAKRKLERNGYYDSLRGKPVSEACKAAAARMWREVREGKRKAGISKFLESLSPYRRKSYLQRISELRKKMVRRERARLLYGLEQKTRLTIVRLSPFTRSQVNHRYNALKRGYFFMEDCSEGSGERYNIYYDGETARSPRFETNLEKDGFRIMEWKKTEDYETAGKESEGHR